LILNVIDAFNVNVDFADARVKRQTCQDRQFLCRVAPAYIQRGISLGKTQLLRFSERLGI